MWCSSESNGPSGKHFQDVCKLLIGLGRSENGRCCISKTTLSARNLLSSFHLRCEILCLWCFRSSAIDFEVLLIFECARGSAKLTTVPSQIWHPKTVMIFDFVASVFCSFALGLCWFCGPLALWPFGPLAFGPLALLALLALWPFGPLALWPFGPLALSLFAPLALWLFGPFGSFCPFAVRPFALGTLVLTFWALGASACP